MGRYPTVEHDFYCINCGKKGMPLARKTGKQKEKFHRKKLYCLNCKTEVNHIECRNQEEIETFKMNFALGLYKEEAAESLGFTEGITNGRKD